MTNDRVESTDNKSQSSLSDPSGHGSARLPVIENCDNCGACCRRTPVPPFQPGEESVWQVTSEQWQPVLDRIAADQQFDDIPCVWFDEDETRCLHYNQRPQACRDFEIGSTLCRLSRYDAGLPA